MPRLLTSLYIAAAIMAWGAIPHPAAADLTATLVQVPITASAIANDPALANAETWQLQVASDGDLFTMEIYVRLAAATIYQHPLGHSLHLDPPTPVLVSIAPALEFDSYIDLPGTMANGSYGPSSHDYLDLYVGPLGWTTTGVHAWVSNAPPDPGPHAYTAAQLTLVPSQAEFQHEWMVRLYEDAPGGAVQHVFTSPGVTSPLGGDTNLDFTVDGADLELWQANFGQVGMPPFDFAPGLTVDFDNDGDTDDLDGSILLSNYGTANATPQQGDANGNGVINADDYKHFFDFNWGHKWNPADVDQDKDVDGADFLRWQQQLGGGFTLPPPENVALPVPECATLTLGILAFSAALAVGRRSLV